MKLRTLFTFPAFLLALHASAQNSTERVLPHFYARDERTEITLSPHENGSASFEFRVYGSVEKGPLGKTVELGK